MEDEITLDELLQIIIRDKGGTPQDYYDLMDYIAYHETGPVHHSVPDQRMKPDAQQYIYDQKTKKYLPTGTGKGLFMFESHPEAGGNMASNWLENILTKEGVEMPQWHRDIWEGTKSVDASKLTADQQKMLFLAYHRMHPKSDFSELWSEKKDKPQWWADYHWAGTENIPKHIEAFTQSMAAKDSSDLRKLKEQQLELEENLSPVLNKELVDSASQRGPFDFLFKSLKNSSIIDKESKKKSPWWLGYSDGGVLTEKEYEAQTQLLAPYGTPEYEEAYLAQGKTGETINRAYWDELFRDWMAVRNLGEANVIYDKESGENVADEYPYFHMLREDEREWFDNDTVLGKGVRSKAKYGPNYMKDFNRFVRAFTLDAPKNLIMDPALTALSAPQAAVIEGVEALKGNYADYKNIFDPDSQRRPSDVWSTGDKTKDFWMDVLGDPANIAGGIGLGRAALSKTFKTSSKNIVNAPYLSNSTKATNTFTKNTAGKSNTEIKKIIKKYSDDGYFNSTLGKLNNNQVDILSNNPNLLNSVVQRTVKENQMVYRAVDVKGGLANPATANALKKAGVDINNPTAVAQYMSSHVPLKGTGTGSRASLNPYDVTDEIDWLNTIPKKGQTDAGIISQSKYGDYITKLRRHGSKPDFLKGDWEDWLTKEPQGFKFGTNIQDDAYKAYSGAPYSQSSLVKSPEETLLYSDDAFWGLNKGEVPYDFKSIFDMDLKQYLPVEHYNVPGLYRGKRGTQILEPIKTEFQPIKRFDEGGVKNPYIA